MISRRNFLLASPFVLAGCAAQKNVAETPLAEAEPATRYGAITDEPFPLPAVNLKRIKPRFLRTEVSFDTREHPGTVVVDTRERHAYLVMPNGRALRYGVGVGREEAFNFQGEAIIQRKAEWPRWTPTQDMIRREPERYSMYAGGLEGGPTNPLGARALYLYRDGQDTLYRLHGTTEPWTIGTMVSSGCVRFLNHDIIDLYRRVPVGAKVVVRSGGTGVGSAAVDGDEPADNRAL